MKKLVINDKGVFEQEITMLSTTSLALKKRKLQNQITLMRGRIQDNEMDIQRYRIEIKQAEENLALLNGPIVEAYIAKEKQRIQEAYDKAQNLLRECIGDELYGKLQENKKIVFTAKDNITYKIENNGRVYRLVASDDKKDWKLLCIIKPQNLPLPDFLLSLFVNVRENPSKYPLKRRWR